MALYVDTSALLKRYVAEANSDECERYLLADPLWISGRHALVEARRNLRRLLSGEALAGAREQFGADWRRMQVVELDEATCEVAAGIAEMIGARSLDALHLAAAIRAGRSSLTFVSFDLRLAQAARGMGFTVWGA